MHSVLQDLTFAARSFVRAPRFTIPAVLALALGIGATSATFSVIRGVMLEPLPYRDPDRIVVVWETNLERNRLRNVVGAANYVEWRERNRSLEHLGLIGPARLNITLGSQPEEVSGFAASSDVFAALGVQPALGRGYTALEDEAGHDQVIVVSHEFWQTHFGGRADVVGTSITANGRPRTIVGVMPPRFTVIGQRANFLIPYGWTLEALRAAPGRGSSHGIARLRDGVSFEQATSDMQAVAAQLEAEFPDRNTGWSVALVPIHEQMVDEIRPALRVLAGAVGLVLLIACVNVANLLLARSTVRQREMGLRAALGARRGRLVRQMLSESVLLGGIGGVAGVVLALLFHRGLLALVAERLTVPRLNEVTMNLPVLAVTLALALATGLLFGFVPALLASRAVNDAGRDGGRHGGGMRARRALGLLVIVEVALSLVLLTGAGLLLRSFVRLQHIDPGFRSEGLLTFRVQVPSTRYGDAARSAGFFNEALTRIAALPGVERAGAVSFLPLAGLGIGTGFYRTDQPVPEPGDEPSTDVRPVTPGFFRAMGIPHIAGRDFRASDLGDSPNVAIVSDMLARQYLDRDPIGTRLHVSVGPRDDQEYEVVGVVGDIRMTSLEGDVRPAIYIPHTQLAIGMMTFVIRTPLDPRGLVTSAASVIHAIDPELPLAEVRTMTDVVDATLSRPRIVATLLSVFALMALALAGVGVYGVMAYTVAQRTQEIGVRMALGATPHSVFRLVLGQAVRLVAVGVAAGLVAASGLMRVLDTLLYRTPALDPLTFATTTLVLLLVALLASYVPARRGTRIAAVEALRTD